MAPLTETYSFLMPFEEKTLADMIYEDFSLLSFLSQIASGLYYLEQNNIFHGDLKPENILVTEDMQIKLIDFGVSIIDPSDESVETTTFGWKSPEELVMCFKETKRGFKSLSWTFGLLVYVMATSEYNSEEYFGTGSIQERMYNYLSKTGTPSSEDPLFLTLRKEINRKTPFKSNPKIEANLSCTLITDDENVNKLILNCLTWNPEERISMRDILLYLRKSPEEEKSLEEKISERMGSGVVDEDFLQRLELEREYLEDEPFYSSAFLACAIYLKCGIKSDTVHISCLSLAAKVMNIDYIYDGVYENNLDLSFPLTLEECKIFEKCKYDLLITTSMTRVTSKEEKEELYFKLLDGEDVLFN